MKFELPMSECARMEYRKAYEKLSCGVTSNVNICAPSLDGFRPMNMCSPRMSLASDRQVHRSKTKNKQNREISCTLPNKSDGAHKKKNGLL